MGAGHPGAGARSRRGDREDAPARAGTRGGLQNAKRMLTHAIAPPRSTPAELRRTEFTRLDDTGVAYLDYGGAALYGESQIRAHAALLARGVFGNPHSEHGASRA